MSIDIRPDDPRIGWDSPLNLNMANGNAVKVLEILGLPPTPDGEITPADLTARILLARLADDTGSPDAVEKGARMIHCGLPEGYYAHRLDALDAIADYAFANDVKVVWY